MLKFRNKPGKMFLETRNMLELAMLNCHLKRIQSPSTTRSICQVRFELYNSYLTIPAIGVDGVVSRQNEVPNLNPFAAFVWTQL